ncbi:MAG: S1 RNA-binding domain-containing protein, partial [bacterium]|nr:S1 RNA-binding domain-containing protein [bacterium]
KGLVVDVGVDGFVPYSQMQDPPKELQGEYSIGDRITVRLIEINEEKRRLVFSQTEDEPAVEEKESADSEDKDNS